MPELPEVETMRRGIEPIVGRRIDAVHFTRCRLKPIRIEPPPARLRRRVVGQRISGVERARKRVIVRLESDETLSRTALVQAMVDNPMLIERPVVFRDERAAVGRPPENVLPLLR